MPRKSQGAILTHQTSGKHFRCRNLIANPQIPTVNKSPKMSASKILHKTTCLAALTRSAKCRPHFTNKNPLEKSDFARILGHKRCLDDTVVAISTITLGRGVLLSDDMNRFLFPWFIIIRVLVFSFKCVLLVHFVGLIFFESKRIKKTHISTKTYQLAERPKIHGQLGL